MLVNGAELPFKGQVVIEETLTPYLYKTGKKKGQKQSPKFLPILNPLDSIIFFIFSVVPTSILLSKIITSPILAY